MRYLDMESWPRRDQFKLFSTFDHPFFGMCANMDLTAFHPFVKQQGVSITVALVYVLARAANAVPEFRYRIRDGKVVEHDVVNPSVTILYTEDLFTFSDLKYAENFAEFAPRAEEIIAQVKKNPWVEDDPQRDDRLYITPIPWVSFTSFDHPMHLSPADSVPRFAMGKFFGDSSLLQMPLSVHAHHGVMDGIHMGRYYIEVQDYLHDPERVLGGT